MSQTGLAWLVLGLALILANLPFFSRRFFLLFSIAAGKTLPQRLLELLVYYLLTGLFGLMLEARIGQIAAQSWEFYAITGALFITLGFPGFVYRYLWRRRH